MKKIILLVVLVSLLQLTSLFASDPSEYYYQNVFIEKIYAYRLGYIVVYRKGIYGMARSYLPKEWFGSTSGKAEIINLGPGKEWPSMSVYYKEGEFSHVRLRVRRERSHETWGTVPRGANVDEYFDGVEEVRLEF
jgi:hypothetical protein